MSAGDEFPQIVFDRSVFLTLELMLTTIMSVVVWVQNGFDNCLNLNWDSWALGIIKMAPPEVDLLYPLV
jgi:hypothetical protein